MEKASPKGQMVKPVFPRTDAEVMIGLNQIQGSEEKKNNSPYVREMVFAW
jgi:hypothetical protein